MGSWPLPCLIEFTALEKVALSFLIFGSLSLFAEALSQRLRVVTNGLPDNRLDHIGKRAWRFFHEVVLQSKVIRGRPVAGLAHAVVFWGFMAFGVGTLHHFGEAYGFKLLGEGPVQQIYYKLLAIIAVATAVGISYLFFRRFVLRPKALGKTSFESGFVAILILTLMITFLVAFADLSDRAASINWWIHAGCILLFLPLISRSKHLHLILAPFNVFFESAVLADIRKLEFEDEDKGDFGVEKSAHFTWKRLFDFMTCVECGRCQDACPAHAAGNALNPKQVILDNRAASFQADQAVVGEFVDANVLWQCTMCAACEEACPLGIEQPGTITDLRRFQVLGTEGAPPEARDAFKFLEQQANLFGKDSSETGELIEELKLPKYDGSQTWLLWPGCYGYYDMDYRKVMGSLVKVLRAARASFGVLGTESCTGDIARRLGNEYLFSEIADQNISLLNEAGVRKIVTGCPHCVRTLGHDYRQFGGEYEVVHHSALIQSFLSEGLLPRGAKGTYVLHDPCYLSRYTDTGVEDLRETVAANGSSLVEVPRTGRNSSCCGGGGGGVLFEHGVDKDRVEELKKALDENPGSQVATGCPFCLNMLSSGLGLDNLRDLSQVVGDSLES